MSPPTSLGGRRISRRLHLTAPSPTSLRPLRLTRGQPLPIATWAGPTRRSETKKKPSLTTGRRLSWTPLWRQRGTTSSFWERRLNASLSTGSPGIERLRFSLAPARCLLGRLDRRCGTHEQTHERGLLRRAGLGVNVL